MSKPERIIVQENLCISQLDLQVGNKTKAGTSIITLSRTDKYGTPTDIALELEVPGITVSSDLLGLGGVRVVLEYDVDNTDEKDTDNVP